ncbi:MAG: SLBB domain-containing protein [Verrucomicrobiota bacterium]|nr:SLBB domain-containing protein [Verrucomicrobiota bacterium]
MKIKKRYLFLFLFALLPIVFSACANLEDIKKNQITKVETICEPENSSKILKQSENTETQLEKTEKTEKTPNHDVIEYISLDDLNKQTKGNSQTQIGQYKLKTGDSVEISILEESNMTKEVFVLPDGTLTFPYVGEIQAKGKTLKDLRNKLSAKLSEFFVDPQVSIIAKTIHKNIKKTRYATIIGAVSSSGKYQLTDKAKILDLIADAGGLQYTGGGKMISNLSASYISRDGKRIQIDFGKLIKKGNMRHNILLNDADILYIASSQANNATIIGAVTRSGKYDLRGTDTLIDLIAQAGGLKYMVTSDEGAFSAANLKASYISRKGKRLNVDFDKLLRLGDMQENILLEPGDFVYIADTETSGIYVMGEVEDPRLIPFTRDINLLEAIARSGGLTDDAEKKYIAIIRNNLGKRQLINIDLQSVLTGKNMQTTQLEEGDIVFIPEKGLTGYSRMSGYIVNMLNLVLTGYQTREAVRFPRLHR